MQLLQMLAVPPSDGAHGSNALKGAGALPSTMDTGGLFALLLAQLGGASSNGDGSSLAAALNERAGSATELADLVEGAMKDPSEDSPLALLKSFLLALEGKVELGSGSATKAQAPGKRLIELAGALEDLGQTEDAPALYDALALDLLGGKIEHTTAKLEEALHQGNPREAAAILDRLADSLEGLAREPEPSLRGFLKAAARQLDQRTERLPLEAREALAPLVETVIQQASGKRTAEAGFHARPTIEAAPWEPLASGSERAVELPAEARNATEALLKANESEDASRSAAEVKTAVKTLLQLFGSDGENASKPSPEAQSIARALLKDLSVESNGKASARPSPGLESLSEALVKTLAPEAKDNAERSELTSQMRNAARAVLEAVQPHGGNHGAESAPALERGAEAMLKVFGQETKPSNETELVLKALLAFQAQSSGTDLDSEPETGNPLSALLRKLAEVDEQPSSRKPPSAEGWRSNSESEADRPLDRVAEALLREPTPIRSGQGVNGSASPSKAMQTLAPEEGARPEPNAKPSLGMDEVKPPQPPTPDVSSGKPTRDLWWAALRPVDSDSAREETRPHSSDSFRRVTRETLAGRRISPLPHAADSKGAENLAEIKNNAAPLTSEGGGQPVWATLAEGRALFLTPETGASLKEAASRGNQGGSWDLSPGVQEPAAGVSRSEAIAASNSAARTESPDLKESVIQSVRYLTSRGERSLSIRLKPDSLGELRVTVTTAQDRIQVQLFTGNAAVRESLEAQLPQLRESLTREGFDVTRLSVEADLTGGNAAEGGHSRTPMHDLLHQRQGGRSIPTLDPDTGERPAGSTSPGSPANRITDQTIDVRI